MGVYRNGIEKGLEEFKMNSDFSLALAQTILSLAVKLFDDLSAQTNALNLEKELIHRFLKNYDRHPIYLNNSFF
jgi:hypothetical protein